VKIDRAIDDVGEAETDLAKRLVAVAERHAVEHDLYHLGHTLARQCVERVEVLRPFAERYGATPLPDGTGTDASSGLLETLRRKASEVLGRSEASGLVLLADLRETYLLAHRAEISWVILLQAAKAARDPELIKAATSSHEASQGVATWLRTKIKVSAPQILVSG
jgi:hypothetical protein